MLSFLCLSTFFLCGGLILILIRNEVTAVFDVDLSELGVL